MFAWRTSYSGLAAVVALGALTAGCGSVGSFGGGAKTAILGEKAASQSPEYPERPKLVMPAPNTPLPAPGQGAAWAATTQQPSKQAAAASPASAAQPAQQESGSWYSGITGVFR